MKKSKKIAQSGECYLVAVYKISLNQKVVKSIDVSKYLKVSRSSVAKALNALKVFGYIDHVYYGSIHLTEKGRLKAQEIDNYNRIIADFMIKSIHMSEYDALNLAKSISHYIENDIIERMKKYNKD